MTNEFNEFLILIRDFSNYYISKSYESATDVTNRIRELTRILWTEHHFEILNTLDSLTGNTYHDIQQFWIECLKFPYNFPIKKKIDGNNIMSLDNILPSDFNEISFHDSKILDIIVEENNLIFSIDLIETWNEGNYGWEQTGSNSKLIFENLFDLIILNEMCDCLDFDDLKFFLLNQNNIEINDFYEIPLINYYIRFFKLNADDITLLKQKRMFLVETFNEQYNKLIIIADNWKLQKFGDKHSINFAYNINQ